jgi:integrase
MPLKLVPPKEGRSPYYRVRGTYLGQYVDRSTQTGDRKVAAAALKLWREEIECGAYVAADAPTFASAALAYMQSGGERRFLPPLLEHFKEKPLTQIGQAEIDAAAVAVLPEAAAATRNRQVYTPISAVLRHAGIEKELKRPKGGRGAQRLHWLRPEEAYRLIAAAGELRPNFGALCTFLTYTGCRLTEALLLEPTDVHLVESFAYVRKTKNGDPRPVHLPPVVVAALANFEWRKKRVFGFSKAGRIYELLASAEKKSGIVIPEGVAFHIFRHTYGAWMRRYGGLDTSGLVETGAWKSRQAAAVYEHVEASEEAKKADLLPVHIPKNGG